MTYYLRTVPDYPTQVWKVDGDAATRLGVSNPEQGPGCYYKAEPGETIWECMKRCTPWFDGDVNPFHKATLGPGQFYPRMARPIDQHAHESPGWSPSRSADKNFIAEARTQLIVLGRQLDRICRTVHPEAVTLSAYGHDIRNLLILACTEAENHWRGILEENCYIKKRYATRDYVKLAPAMGLGQYSVAFKNYPWLPSFAPFQRWGTSSAATQDLPWYDAYNATKHNREANFGRASLEHAFDAVSACVIMMAAQFGLPELVHNSSDLKEMFQLASTPSWPLEEVYIFPYGELKADWEPVNFPFP